MSRTQIVTRSSGTAGLRSAAAFGLAGTSTAPDAAGMPWLVGTFSRFNEWATISSVHEGRFLERVSPGAFARSLKEDRAHIRVLFDHGQDPFIGSRPLCVLEGIGEDVDRAWYRGRMFPTAAAHELAPLLEAGVLGSSFRFTVDRERVDELPRRSEINPEAIPERTILEATLVEVGPCVFPVYRSTSATTVPAAPPSAPPPRMSRDAFLKVLATPIGDSDTPARRADRKAWIDRVLGPAA